MKLLSILIPTYNRANYLEMSMGSVVKMIENLGLYNDVNIVVSNNASTDDTEKVINILKQNTSHVEIIDYKQESNLGLEGNTLFCMSKATGEYAMFVGDDDFIESAYLQKVVDYIKKDRTITCIIPDRIGINLEGKPATKQYYPQSDDMYYKQKDSKLESMFDAHQISGVVVKVEDTLEKYIQANGHNIYPCVFFAGVNIQRGSYIHITKNPVKVTRGNLADFSRRDDNLLTDIWQNISLITNDEVVRRRLEKYLARRWKRMIYRCSNHPFKFSKYICRSEEYSSEAKVSLVLTIYIMSLRYCIASIYKILFKPHKNAKQQEDL